MGSPIYQIKGKAISQDLPRGKTVPHITLALLQEQWYTLQVHPEGEESY